MKNEDQASHQNTENLDKEALKLGMGGNNSPDKTE